MDLRATIASQAIFAMNLPATLVRCRANELSLQYDLVLGADTERSPTTSSRFFTLLLTVTGVGPKVALAIVGVWAATFLLSRYTSVASIVSAVALPVLTVVLGYPLEVEIFAGFTGAGIVLLHRANLRRLRAGTENRFRGLRRPNGPANQATL